MNNNLKRRIMVRVYLEYAKNILISYPDYFMLGFFVIISFISISFQNVLTNIPKNGLMPAFNFLVIAIRNTNWIIQTLIIGFFIRTAFLGIKQAYKNIRSFDWIITRFRY